MCGFRFGHSGFLVFWMLSYVGMLAIGLAIEAMFTILNIRFTPFFLITWIIGQEFHNLRPRIIMLILLQ